MIRPIIKSKNYINIHQSFGIAAATALVVATAAPSAGHAEYRLAGHPAHVNAPPHPPMRPLQTGTVVAAPTSQAQPPRIMPSAAPSVATGHAEDTAHPGDQGHDRSRRDARIIVVGVPSAYYYGAATYYAPGYYGDQYSDGGPAVGPSPLGEVDATSCSLAYSSYDPQSGTYTGDDGMAHSCP
jgi:BA14K-like protein